MTKLKIDFNNGILEVEGEETFVDKIYKEYKELFSIENFNTPKIKNNQVSKKSKPKIKTKKSTSHSVDNSLSLNGLKEFYNERKPTTGYEKNLIFIYFLQKKLGIKNINENHIYTCYKFTDIKAPTALKQSLFETGSIKSWIDTTSYDNIKLSIIGENFLEDNLPKAKKQNV